MAESKKTISRLLKKIPAHTKKFAENSFDFSYYIHELLDKIGITQKELAKKLGKTESEVSKILSPGHNLTFKSLSKLEVALGQDILITPDKLMQTSVPISPVYMYATDVTPDNKEVSEDREGGCEVSDSEVACHESKMSKNTIQIHGRL